MNRITREYADSTVLITGGAGCIGSNLTRSLLSADVDRVIIIDDLSASQPWNLPSSRRVRFVGGSILEDEVLRRAFSMKPDFVFHLAAHFANQNSVDHPEKDLLVNGLGTLKVLHHTNLANPRRFVFASSGCSIYGNNPPNPVPESFLSLHLDTPYQITKLLGELYSNFFHEYHDLPIVNARFFNVYGPGEVPGKYRNVIPNFIYWAIHGRALPITGTGQETRDFTYVDDIVEGVLLCGIVDDAIGEAINLGSGVEMRVIDIADAINSLVGNSAGISRGPKRAWDKVVRRRASIEKARKILGYEPTVPIERGLVKTVEWIKDNWERIDECVGSFDSDTTPETALGETSRHVSIAQIKDSRTKF